MLTCKAPNLVRIIKNEDGSVKETHFYPALKAKVSENVYRSYIARGAVEVPCGKCVACRLEYSRVWANRCYLESLCHPYSWFVTLTYDDAHLVYGSKGIPTLEKDCISKFMKALRKKFDVKIRFFGATEYGDTTMRPHAHLIIFGAPLNDLTIDMPDMSKEPINGKYPIFRRKNRQGEYVMFSQTIYDCWKKGKVEVEDASWNCAAYVSRYVLKKQYGRGKELYERLGILPEFLRMSNRPGIGAEWLLAHKDKLLEFDYLSVKNNKGVQTTRPPRYFEKLMMKEIDSIDWWLMNSNKIERIINARKLFVEAGSSKSLVDKRNDDAEYIEKKSKVLTRDIT